GAEPTEENVAGGLHEVLAFDNPLSLVFERARREVRREDRRRCLLDLQEQWVVAVASEEQDDPVPCADTADPDDLAGEVGVAKPVDQVPSIAREAVAIQAEVDLEDVLGGRGVSAA